MYPKGIVGWAIRGSQLFFAIIVLALAGALVANQPSGGAPSQINYAIFVGVFSILTWFYTAGATHVSSDGIGAPVVIVILDCLNLLFYFAGGVALAVALSVHSCGNIAYIETNWITAGSSQRCHEAQACTAFLWFGMSCESFVDSRIRDVPRECNFDGYLPWDWRWNVGSSWTEGSCTADGFCLNEGLQSINEAGYAGVFLSIGHINIQTYIISTTQSFNRPCCAVYNTGASGLCYIFVNRCGSRSSGLIRGYHLKSCLTSAEVIN